MSRTISYCTFLSSPIKHSNNSGTLIAFPSLKYGRIDAKQGGIASWKCNSFSLYCGYLTRRNATAS